MENFVIGEPERLQLKVFNYLIEKKLTKSFPIQFDFTESDNKLYKIDHALKLIDLGKKTIDDNMAVLIELLHNLELDNEVMNLQITKLPSQIIEVPSYFPSNWYTDQLEAKNLTPFLEKA